MIIGYFVTLSPSELDSVRMVGVVIDNESPMEKPHMMKNSVGNRRGTIL